MTTSPLAAHTQAFIELFSAQSRGISPALVEMVNQTVRRPAVSPKTANHSINPLEGDDSEIFEIDRSSLVLQLDTLRRAIDETAEEMEMVADEAVFTKSVSKALTRAARKLSRASQDLKTLHRIIQQARPPAAPGQPRREPTPRNRPKTRV